MKIIPYTILIFFISCLHSNFLFSTQKIKNSPIDICIFQPIGNGFAGQLTDIRNLFIDHLNKVPFIRTSLCSNQKLLRQNQQKTETLSEILLNNISPIMKPTSTLYFNYHFFLFIIITEKNIHIVLLDRSTSYPILNHQISISSSINDLESHFTYFNMIDITTIISKKIGSYLDISYSPKDIPLKYRWYNDSYFSFEIGGQYYRLFGNQDVKNLNEEIKPQISILFKPSIHYGLIINSSLSVPDKLLPEATYESSSQQLAYETQEIEGGVFFQYNRQTSQTDLFEFEFARFGILLSSTDNTIKNTEIELPVGDSLYYSGFLELGISYPSRLIRLFTAQSFYIYDLNRSFLSAKLFYGIRWNDFFTTNLVASFKKIADNQNDEYSINQMGFGLNLKFNFWPSSPKPIWLSKIKKLDK